MSERSDHEAELDQLDSDGEPPEFDLTPRPAAAGARRAGSNKRRRWTAVAILVVIVVAAGFLLSKALGSATDYFYRVDQAVAHRKDLGTRRFRIQGTVTNEPQSVSLENNAQKITFEIAANGVNVPVVYTGSDPPALFRRCEPVVIVGHWSSPDPSARFIGSQIIIKHTESYTAEHEDRLKTDPGCTSVASS